MESWVASISVEVMIRASSCCNLVHMALSSAVLIDLCLKFYPLSKMDIIRYFREYTSRIMEERCGPSGSYVLADCLRRGGQLFCCEPQASSAADGRQPPGLRAGSAAHA